MLRICFVCHGNICRSPMAEAAFADILRRAGAQEQFDVFSRATSAEEIGNGLYPPAARELARHGLSLPAHTARQLSMSEYRACDLIVVMDNNNLRNLSRMTGGDPERKARRLRDFTDSPGEIADPWYTGDFQTAFRQISDGCEALYARAISGTL